jgi:hypothetical protein
MDQTVALEWLHHSLKQGGVISSRTLKVVQEREGHAYALLPDTVDAARLANPKRGGVIGTCPVQGTLTRVLNDLAERGAACVVMEDEMRRKTDPNPTADGLPTAFVGERVLHWGTLGDDPKPLIQLFHRGSHGYPLNAFVTSAKDEELGLVDGADLDDVGVAILVSRSLAALIVAAYDAETFLIWEPGPDPRVTRSVRWENYQRRCQ